MIFNALNKFFWKEIRIVLLSSEKLYTRTIKLPSIPRIGDKIPMHSDLFATPMYRMQVIDVLHSEGGYVTITTAPPQMEINQLNKLIRHLISDYNYQEERV